MASISIPQRPPRTIRLSRPLLAGPAMVLAAAALSGCEPAYEAPPLYMASTAACSSWTDGNRFELPNQIAVFAASPASVGADLLELPLVYRLSRGKDAQFASLGFKLSLPKGAELGRASVSYIDRAAIGSSRKPVERIDKLHPLLRADASSEETIYRIRLRFQGKLPERFDLTPPPMVINGSTYPVRTYTYRWFEQRKSYGLCT